MVELSWREMNIIKFEIHRKDFEMIKVIHKKCNREVFKLLEPHKIGNMFRAPDAILPNGQHPEPGTGVECPYCKEGFWDKDCIFEEVPPMKTRYKVVKGNRTSAIINANSKYVLRYMPRTIVQADPETLGIFLFKYKWHAEKWVHDLSYTLPYTIDRQIIEVEPLTKGKVITNISRGTKSSDLDNFYDNEIFVFEWTNLIPEGTYGHHAVRVLT